MTSHPHIATHHHQQRTKDGTWVSTCLICGAEKRIKNLSFRSTRDSGAMGGSMCATCREGRDPDDGVPSVALELDLCGCADQDRIDQLMLEYLGRVEEISRLSATVPAADLFAHPVREQYRETQDKIRSLSNENETDAMMLISHLAERLEWNEHGSSIRSCWLTDDGKEALAVLRARAPKETSDVG